MDDVLVSRMRRVYAALDSLEEFDIGQLKAQVVDSPTFFGIFQDFTGGLTPEQLANFIQSAIYNVAHLRDVLKRFAKRNEKRAADVEDAVKASEGLRIVVDLSNLDKHDEPRTGRSGKSPRLININRVLRLVAQPGSGVGLTLNPDGTPRILGSGTASAVIVADVIDAEGTKLGELGEFLDLALAAWEALLHKWGIDHAPPSGQQS
jgi:hypothetical protein